MCRKLSLMVSLASLLGLIGNASAALPAGWQSQDIGTTGGSANESNGTWTVIGDGADIWGTSDAFHYAYVPLIGDGEISACVVDNGTGSNTWAKGGVMIRETLQADSRHAMMIITDSDGGGIANQARPSTGGSSVSFHGDITASPPHWVRLVREGDMITAYHGDDGVNWELFTDTSPDGAMANPLNLPMPEEVYIGLCVTSHAAGELRTYTFDNVNVMLPVIATSPDPDDGAIHPETWASLSWNAGHTAVSHDVYFGESEVDVEAGTGDSFRGNVPNTFFIVGFIGNPYPDGLVTGTTYFWRIDEVETDGTKHTGKVWSFTVPPKTAYNPSPENGAMFVDADTILEWSAGYGSILHNVYFGDNFEDVNSATGGAPSPTTTFNPGPLEYNKTYYWRVDEFNPPITLRGEVWSFKTSKEGGGIKGEYFNNTDLSGVPVLTRIDPQIDVYWNPGPVGPGVNEDNFSVRWTGEIEAPFSEPFTFIIGSDDGARMYFNGELIINDWGGGHDYTEVRSQPIDLVEGEFYSIVVEGFELGGEAEWRLFWESPSMARQNVPQAALAPPIKASNPSPLNGATGTKMTPILKWNPGDYVVSHEVYFGTDAEAVANATKASPEYKGTKVLGEESFDPGKLAWHTPYFWRIDEVNDLNPDSPWVGNLWSFTTGDFIVVDDFEDYDVVKEIWKHWLDGIGYGAVGTLDFFAGNGTGSAVGDESSPSYMEETIVHGGLKSLVVSFDNNKQGSAKYSETEKTLDFPRDFTEEGVSNLSLWFRGNPVSVGSFVEEPTGTYTMTGSGADIWNVNGVEADEFHFAYKMLSGAGSIIARINSVENTNDWAKAGVMIRETLNPDSAHAFVCVTPTNGVAAQGRPSTGGASFNTNETGITTPHWVKLERSIGGTFTVSHSANGSTWVPVTGASPQTIQMGANVYIGLALTAHDATLTCQAVFSNVTTTGNVTGEWTNQDIGIASNDAEPLYVALSNETGTPAVVVHDDPAAAQIDTWTEWIIPLQAFADQGIILSDVDRIAIGLGTEGNMAIPGGSGEMFFDDIRLTKPTPEPEPEPEP